MAPVLAGAGLGFAWVRLGHPYPVDFVTRLVFNIGTPALVLAAVSGADIDISAFGRTMLATALVVLAMGAVTFLMARLLGRDWRVLLAPMMYPNTGNMGLPVVLYAFGGTGFAFGITVMITVTLFQFTLGTMMASRGNPLRALLRTPTVYAILIVVGLLITDSELPRWLDNTVDLISGFTVPLMLITLGVSLASIRVTGLMSGVGFSLLRIPVAALLAWGPAFWWGSRPGPRHPGAADEYAGGGIQLPVCGARGPGAGVRGQPGVRLHVVVVALPAGAAGDPDVTAGCQRSSTGRPAAFHSG